MIRTQQDVENLYGLFGQNNLKELAAAFAEDATYSQRNTGMTLTGRDQVGMMMQGWKDTFGQDATVGNVIVIPMTLERRAQVDGATAGYVATFIGRGRYVQDLTDTEGFVLEPARGQDVALPLVEHVWVNDKGEIIRVENQFAELALKG